MPPNSREERANKECRVLLDWLYAAQRFGIKLGLENTFRLLDSVGQPQQSLSCIHVAGTNGKGSVCAMLDACLRSAGIKTGLTTSPHLLDFSERIRVGGIPISPEGIACGLSQLKQASSQWDYPPTFFELTTVLALWWFAEQGCEVAVLETGMGGRLDATNVVDPLVAVITPVAMDHAAYLGDSLEKIAAEKAGIIKPGKPVLSARQTPEVESVLRETAARMAAPLSFVDQLWDGPCGLEGKHQLANAALCAAALRVAEPSISEKSLRSGMAGVQWPGRFQHVGQDWILDGAHNPHAARAFLATWKEKFGDRKTSVIFGCLKDKEAQKLLSLIELVAAVFYFVPVHSDRGMPPELLPALTSRPSTLCPNLSEALRLARRQPDSPPTIITGSLFLVGEAMTLLPKS